MENSLLTIVTFLPLAGAVLLLTLPKDNFKLIRVLALVIATTTFLLSLFLFFYFDVLTPRMQFEQLATWIPSLGANYHVGIDGISLFLVLLTTFLTPITVLSSFTQRNTSFACSFWKPECWVSL